MDGSRNIQLYTFKDERTVYWKIRKTSDNHYFILSQLSGYNVDIEGGTEIEGANISQYYFLNNSQQWDFEKVEDIETPTTSTTETPVTTTVTSTTITTVKPTLIGDTNGNGSVNASDLSSTLLKKIP